MTDQGRIVLSILAGAVVGGLAGFLLFTDRGRQIRQELQPHLDELTGGMRELQDMVLRVRDTANESWRQVESVVSELGRDGASWADDARRH